MASQVQICNRALQKLGAGRITDLSDNSPRARECGVAYEDVLEAELRSRAWNFAIKRAQLAASTTAPLFGGRTAFPLPSDFLRLLAYNERDGMFSFLPTNDRVDWQIEGNQILTCTTDVLNIRYIARVDDPNLMDSSFREAFASKLAMELCEPITQSNTKYQKCKDDYKDAIAQARSTNAFESISADPPDDDWLLARY